MWTYNKELDVHTHGTQSDGCGVFQEGDKWFVNVCYGDDIQMFDNLNSEAEAKELALKELNRLRGELS